MAIDKVVLRTQFSMDRDRNSAENALFCDEPTLAQQQYAEEVDINTILRRFRITGEMPKDVRMPTYADYDEVFDFHSAANAIALAHEAFDAMPAEVRYRFGNDPARFVAFCSDENNRDEAVKLGLVPASAGSAGAPVVPAPAGGGEGSAAPQGGTVST